MDVEMASTESIGRWVEMLPRERTAAVKELATDGIRDLIGCMIAGSVEPTVRQVVSIVKGWGLGTSTIVGDSLQVASASAAFTNGVAAHILDFDDSYSPMTGHPSATLVPAILAVAEERRLTGAAVLDAYVVGLEVIAAVGGAMNPSHYMAGWHSTATLGVIGASAAIGRLLGLGAPSISAAISNAVSFSSGSRLQLGSAMKSVHAGMAARDAVVAATLAEAGVAGNPEPFAGPCGFISLYAGKQNSGTSFDLPTKDEPLAIVTPGITFKPYPTCGSTHRSLDSLLELRARHFLSAHSIEDVELTIPALNVRNLIYDRPITGLEAKFSMQYCAAVALLYGEVTLKDFTSAAVGRPEVQTLLPRIRMLPLSGSEVSTKDYLELPVKTTVRLKDGQTFEDCRFHRRGSQGAPMRISAHRAKFLECASVALSDQQGNHLLDEINRLYAAPGVTELMRALRV